MHKHLLSNALHDDRASPDSRPCALCGKHWIPPAGFVFADGRAFWRNERIPFPPSEAFIFKHLYERRGQAVSTTALEGCLYSGRKDGGATSATIKVFISRIRNKLRTFRLPFAIIRDGNTYVLIEHELRW